MSESYILCEGYHDRAFWAGWLMHLGCTDPSTTPGKSGRTKVYDPWNTPVERGQFAYNSKSKGFVRVVPCHGKDNILHAAQNRLNERGTKQLARLVINVDCDSNADGTRSNARLLSPQAVEAMVQKIDPKMTLIGKSISLDGGATEVNLIEWHADDSAGVGLPNQQTLERLACASLAASYPDRGPLVQKWLDSRNNPAAIGPKEFAWSYMAGWHAELGCEAFYSVLWSDQQIAVELEKRLRSSGAWQIAEVIAG